VDFEIDYDEGTISKEPERCFVPKGTLQTHDCRLPIFGPYGTIMCDARYFAMRIKAH